MAPEHTSRKIGKTVGERLRAARIAQNYTQGQLASPDFSVSYISAIERGQIHPSLRALEILAGRLGLSSTQLLPLRPQQDEEQNVQPPPPEREEDEADAALLEVHLLLRQGESAKALSRLEKLPTKRLKQQQILYHCYFRGWAYLKLSLLESSKTYVEAEKLTAAEKLAKDYLAESEKILTEAEKMAKEIEDHILSLRITNLRGIAYNAMGNTEQAMRLHQRCLTLLEEASSQEYVFLAEICTYLADYHLRRDEVDAAESELTKAVSYIAQLNNPQALQAFYWQQSQKYSQTKAFELAARFAYKCFYLQQEAASKAQQSMLLYYLGQSLIQGNQQRAGAYLADALQQQRIQQDPLSFATVSMHKAQWHIGRKELDEADRYAQRACDVTESLGDSLIAAEVYLTLGQIEYALQRYASGDTHFVKGLEMLERIGSTEELSQQSVRYAELLEQRGMAREAFTYFRRAFQTSQKG